MQVIDFFKHAQLHPVVDHFSVALLIVGILVDLFASLVPLRVWLRYMALTLMILGAISAGASNVTGGWEAERVWDSVTGPAKDVLRRHAQIGDYLPWVFGALALWRLGIQFVGFIARSRVVYIVIAVLAGIALMYQGHLGGVLAYDYGVGTALMPHGTPSPAQLAPNTPSTPVSNAYVSPAETPIPTLPASPVETPAPPTTPLTAIPTVAVPTATATPAAPPSDTAAHPGAATTAPSAVPSPPESKPTTL
jgi:uncharacterized membrane protein